MKVAIVHDWLTGMRGGERALQVICSVFPDAEIVTLVHVPGSVSPAIERHRIRTSVVQRLPGAARWYRQYLPFFPTAVELLDLDAADVIISTSHCAAKAVVPAGRAVHLCYCHTPMRYAWDQFDAYFGPARLGPWASGAARRAMAWIARWDRRTAGRVHHFLANSRHVAGRIARYYNRRATVIYGPVDTAFFTPGPAPDRKPYFLVVSALVPYKRVDVAIAAAALLGARLKIVGTGPEERRLRAAAGPNVEFLGSVTAEALRDAYRGATALVLPAEEDFGLAPVEALACGRPVVALGRGGACETIDAGATGALVEVATPEAFAAAMREVAAQTFDPAALRARAERFSTERFEARFRDVVRNTVMADTAW